MSTSPIVVVADDNVDEVEDVGEAWREEGGARYTITNCARIRDSRGDEAGGKERYKGVVGVEIPEVTLIPGLMSLVESRPCPRISCTP